MVAHKLFPQTQSSTPLGQPQHLQRTREGEIHPHFSCPIKQTPTSMPVALSFPLAHFLEEGVLLGPSPPPEGGIRETRLYLKGAQEKQCRQMSDEFLQSAQLCTVMQFVRSAARRH